MGGIGRKLLAPLHNARERADAERIYGVPSPKRDAVLKKRSSILGKILNLAVMRPHKGMVVGRDFGKKAKPFTEQDIINERKKL